MIGPCLRIISTENNKLFSTAAHYLRQQLVKNARAIPISHMAVTYNTKADNLSFHRPLQNAFRQFASSTNLLFHRTPPLSSLNICNSIYMLYSTAGLG
ncbi:hypothetical protein D3C81_1580980 [compost metagenome]